jgi:hypothetical protein
MGGIAGGLMPPGFLFCSSIFIIDHIQGMLSRVLSVFLSNLLTSAAEGDIGYGTPVDRVKPFARVPLPYGGEEKLVSRIGY